MYLEIKILVTFFLVVKKENFIVTLNYNTVITREITHKYNNINSRQIYFEKQLR